MYIVNDKFNCLRDSFKITIDRTTGIDNQSLENFEMEVFPNPSDGIVWIELPYSQFYKIDLLDEFGKLIFTKMFQVGALDQRIKLKLESSHLSSGLYLLSASDGQTQRVRKLIIK